MNPETTIHMLFISISHPIIISCMCITNIIMNIPNISQREPELNIRHNYITTSGILKVILNLFR